ncbi:MAG: fibrobacter succinogenes major paralogous domain-containing protein [Prevotellaceae bacterium]|jgi:hypothetical protein|nr:fibrobacter succinogenes major paralogous domain-containing protein [Prevotellaceae bacterium]
MKKVFSFKMHSRTTMRLSCCGCLLVLFTATFAACSKDNYRQDSDTPPHAASEQTWVIESADGTIKQTWSDAIQLPECNKTDFDGGEYDAPKADCRSDTHEGNTYYYYNWPYVDAHAADLCPSPWRVPTLDDFISLDLAFGGAAINTAKTEQYMLRNYVSRWGGAYGGYAKSTSAENTPWVAYLWSTTVPCSPQPVQLFVTIGYLALQDDPARHDEFQIRCVK